jgi:branched-chain amino acid transport system substrate-binding protein
MNLNRRMAFFAVVFVGVLVAGCGTRVSHARLVAGAGGGPVVLQGAQGQAGSGDQAGSVQVPGASSVGGGGTLNPVLGGSTPRGAGAAGAGTRVSGLPSPGTAGTANQVGGLPSPGAAGSNTTPVVIGSVGTYSGVVGASLGTVPQALGAWAKWTNAHGGVAGHPVQVYVTDDQSSNANAAAAVQDMVENKHAVALVGSFIPQTYAGVQSYVDPHQFPVVGGDGVTPAWNSDPMLFNIGANLTPLAYGGLKYAATLGKPKIALFYCIESTVCSSAKPVYEHEAPVAGDTLVDEEQISLGQADFTANCLNARGKGAQVIVVIADASAMSRVADNCAAQGYHPLISTGALSANNQQPSDPNLDGMVIGLQTFPWFSASTPAQEAFQTAMATYAPGLVLSGPDAQAWASAELFKRAVELTGSKATSGPITRQLVLQGLWQIRNETLGGLAANSLNFVQGEPSPSVKCLFLAQIKGGKWTAPIGLQQLCEP